MRFLIIGAILILAQVLAQGTFAQTAPRSQMEEHPDWFTEERIPYRPCPASVGFPNGRNACLGCPRACRWLPGDLSK